VYFILDVIQAKDPRFIAADAHPRVTTMDVTLRTPEGKVCAVHDVVASCRSNNEKVALNAAG